jgi:hypothetical protein
MKTTFNGFESGNSFGHVVVWTESDGSIWAKISLNGVVLSYERIDSEVDREPEAVLT